MKSWSLKCFLISSKAGTKISIMCWSKPSSKKIRSASKIWRLRFTPWVKTTFVCSRLFSQNHQKLLKILLCHSVILIVNRSFNREEFFIRKNYFSLSVSAFKSQRRIFFFCFRTGVRCLFLIIANIKIQRRKDVIRDVLRIIWIFVLKTSSSIRVRKLAL